MQTSHSSKMHDKKKVFVFYFLNMHYALSQKIMMLLLRDKFKKINGKCASFHTWLWTVIYDIFIKLKAVSSEENNSHYSMQDKVYQKSTQKNFTCYIFKRCNDTYISQILEVRIVWHFQYKLTRMKNHRDMQGENIWSEIAILKEKNLISDQMKPFLIDLISHVKLKCHTIKTVLDIVLDFMVIFISLRRRHRHLNVRTFILTFKIHTWRISYRPFKFRS